MLDIDVRLLVVPQFFIPRHQYVVKVCIHRIECDPRSGVYSGGESSDVYSSARHPGWGEM